MSLRRLPGNPSTIRSARHLGRLESEEDAFTNGYLILCEYGMAPAHVTGGTVIPRQVQVTGTTLYLFGNECGTGPKVLIMFSRPRKPVQFQRYLTFCYKLCNY